MIVNHLNDYFEFTGKTFRNTNEEFGESAHSTLFKHENRSMYRVTKKLGTPIHLQKAIKSHVEFNSRNAGLVPSSEFTLRKTSVVNCSNPVKRKFMFKKSYVKKHPIMAVESMW